MIYEAGQTLTLEGRTFEVIGITEAGPNTRAQTRTVSYLGLKAKREHHAARLYMVSIFNNGTLGRPIDIGRL